MKTESETLFEQFCAGNGISAKPIPVTPGAQTPDYEITLGGQSVIAEITQIDPNEGDLKYQKDKTKGVGGVVGSRIRIKIGSKARQLKARTGGKVPGFIVIMNNTCVPSYTNELHVLAAMYGFHTFVLNGPDEAAIQVKGHKFGGGRTVTPDAKTSLSAVAILEVDNVGKPSLRIYHNIHSKAPLNVDLFSFPNVRHYAPGPKEAGKFQGWAEIRKA